MTIYNPNAAKVAAEPQVINKKRNPYWWMENFHPEGFLTHEKNQQGIYGLLTHSDGEFYWVADSVIYERGQKEDGSTKWVPYNYKSLLTHYAPYLLFCFWDVEHDCIIQIDLTGGSFCYRHLTIPEFNSYIFSQHQRQFVILQSQGEWGSIPNIRKLFNSKWMLGQDIFPVSCSKQECKQWLPQFNRTEAGFHIPQLTWVDQSPRDITRRWVPKKAFITHTFTTHQDMPLIIDTFDNLIGETLSVEGLHEVLDSCGYRKGVKKGRITTAIRTLHKEGIELKRIRKKIKQKTTYFYEVHRIKREIVSEELIG